jgi:hypothetical protein
MAAPASSSLLGTSPAPFRPLAPAHAPTVMVQATGRRALAANPLEPPFLRPPPQGLTTRVRRRCACPSSGQKSVAGELARLPTFFPSRPRRRSRRISASRAAGHGQGPHYEVCYLPRVLNAQQGYIGEDQSFSRDPGAKPLLK